ncbi:hypothetical protein V1264_006065 [Littorina saxatilis]|uniref:P2X purinoreceptor 7 intracellular domain-containing protein n=1 Tax=Littorina saxatilis TaxID=31220 RepID=A0AAN9AWV3_9CAEN
MLRIIESIFNSFHYQEQDLNAVHEVATTSALNASTTIHIPYAAESQRNSGETPRNLRLEVASAAVRAEEAAAGDAVKEALATLTAVEKDAVLQRMAQKDPLYVSCFIRDVHAHVNTERVDNSDVPGWCRCGHCVTMESQRERLCCGREDECVTSTPTFFDLCMKPSVVEVCGVQNYGYTYHRSNPEFSNRKFRSAAYRFYTLWQWGSLGAKHRVVLPSCVVARIRWAFPDPNQSYTGYQSCNE